jgi:cephalosporin-C deacetylase-like acetyl esterase
MHALSRRDFLYFSLAASAGLAHAADARPKNIHEQLLEIAADQERKRRARFAAVKTKADLEALQKSLRDTFLRLIDGLPQAQGIPPVRKTGTIEAEDYVVEKLAYESLPGYFVPALLYKPKKRASAVPGVLSPCGHSTNGKAADSYQALHINLVKRGFVVLCYDPVGQGERSQFWDAANGKSRFDRSCGEHAVLGNPLYLLGSSLARYRIWDGMRGIDLLQSLEEVDKGRIGCVGNSGGGTLTAYISALDPRVTVSAPCCYITTLPRRMGNRIELDPGSDPEQDFFGFVSEGIDHAGLLTLMVPRPTLIGSAQFDFFPIEGARESFQEAKRLFEVAGAGERIAQAEAAEKHALSLPLRLAVYEWFERWLAGRKLEGAIKEVPVTPRPDKDLLVCADGQVNSTFQSRPLLPLAWAEFKNKAKPARKPLRELVRLDPELADFALTEVHPVANKGQTLVVCINGNEAPSWQDEKAFLDAVGKAGFAAATVDPRGVGRLRPDKSVKQRPYADPLVGVEENIAYNAFLVGKSLLEMRVTDVLSAVRRLSEKVKPSRVVVCGRRDSAVVAFLAAALEPRIDRVAVQEALLSYAPLFRAEGYPINAASLLPDLLRSFGDVADVVTAIKAERVLIADGIGAAPAELTCKMSKERFTDKPAVLTEWL